MSWIQRYKLRNYLRNTVGILPVFGMVEHQMALFIDLSVAAEIPAVGTKPPSPKIRFHSHSCHVRTQRDLPPFRPRQDRSRGW